MMRFAAAGMVTSLLWLSFVNVEGASGEVGDEELREKFRQSLEDVRADAERCQLHNIVERVDRLLSTWLNGAQDMNVTVAMVAAFVGEVQQELTSHLFFRIPKEERSFYEDVQITEASMKAFPSAVPEIRDAGRCFALDQPTAAVLHLMRSLETPLFSLASTLNVKPSSPNWQVVINECEREIKALKSKHDQEFYGGAAANFLYFKNAWRNHAMHGRDTYNKPQAFDIMMHVAAFMNHLSKKICEPGGSIS